MNQNDRYRNTTAVSFGEPSDSICGKMAEVPTGLSHVEQVCGALSETALDIQNRLETVLRGREPSQTCCKENEPDASKVSDRLERVFQRLQGVQCHLREILDRLEL